MKLAISNIAWPADMNSEVYDFLRGSGIDAIEVAPTRVWPLWEGITVERARQVRRRVEDAGLTICSLQSILFQKPELRLFEPNRNQLYDHLRVCADLAVVLGADCLVFGAPRNRLRGDLSEADAFAIAVDFFAKVGAHYAQRDVCLVFEANPRVYGCDFATDSRSAARLVRVVGSPGFGLHLDTGCMRLAGEDGQSAILENRDILRHFHVSEPHLAGFSVPEVAHGQIASALNSASYDAWAALEMRAVDPSIPAIEKAVRYFRKMYGRGVDGAASGS